MLHNPNHESARREVLAALDAEMAKLKSLITATDALIVGMNERNRQLEELHHLRHARLALLDDGSEIKPYNLTEPSAMWNMR